MSHAAQPHSRLLCLTGLIFILGIGLPGTALAKAQTPPDLRQLNARFSNSRAEGQTLRVADLFGESDEEKAAREAARQHEQNQDTNIQRLHQQIDQMMDQNSHLLGQIEVLNHRLDEYDQKIDRMRKDFQYRLCSLVAAQMGVQGGDQSTQSSGPAMDCPGMNAAVPAPPAGGPPQGAMLDTGPRQQAPSHDDGGVHLAPPPGVLGTLPPDHASAGPPPGQAVSAGSFNGAMRLLAKAQYDDAKSAFRNFADGHPRDPQTPEAVYWAGDIAYVQKDYPGAARAFAEELKNYPDSPRAPESMLKLGQSLVAMGQKKEGCTALGAIQTKYPNASPGIVKRTSTARKEAACHGG